jgi:tripartite-type tricarboxylate transporter receptor subunit TctC
MLLLSRLISVVAEMSANLWFLMLRNVPAAGHPSAPVEVWSRIRPSVLHLWLLVPVAALMAATTFDPSRAQANWPTRNVTIIVPNAPGGFTDMMARLAAQYLSKKLGQPFIVENRAGGAGVIGATQVANAQPDGYTFLFTSPSTILTQPLLQKLNYDPDSLIPICIFGSLPFLFGIKSSLPPKTMQEFVGYVKTHPGKLNYASAGVGGIGYLVSALFVKTAGLDAVHVPYKSAAPATAALLAGEVDMYFAGSPELMPHVLDDRIRILATSGAKRLPNLPDTPAIGEFYPGFQVNTWEAFMAPHGTPKAIIDHMSEGAIEAANDPMINQRLIAAGITPEGATQAKFLEIMKRDRGFYADAIRASGITPAAETSRSLGAK